MTVTKLIGGAAAAALLCTGAMAASAKFTAAWETDKVELLSISTEAGQTGPYAEELLATIKAPNQKELLIGVSGIANLVTFTEAKGKNGAGTSTSVAEGTLGLEVRYAPEGTEGICEVGTLAAPGDIVFASRRQELSVTVDLSIVDTVVDDDNGDLGEVLEIDGSVTVALGLDTTAAHHFNFVATDLQGSNTYDVVACFTAGGSIEVSDEENRARTVVAVGKRMVTVQQVRAVQGDFIDGND